MTNASNDQQLIQEIQNGHCFFYEDEVDRYSDDALIAFANRGEYMIEYLPKNRLSHAVLKAVIENDRWSEAMKFFSSKDTPHYKEMAILAVSKSWTQLKFVEPEVVDAEFYTKTIAKNPKALYVYLVRHPTLLEQLIKPQELEDKMNTGGLNRAAVIGGVIKGKIKSTLISDAYLQKSLLELPHLFAEVLQSEFKPLALELVAQGGWPTAYADQKPSSIKDALKGFKESGAVVAAWHQTYILNCGIEKAVNAMKGPSTLGLLETLYTKEEIKPYLKGPQGNKVKGKWLEDELGM
jgi:hypothetical protein